MSYEVPAAIIAASSALAGGIIGTAGTLLAGKFQHDREQAATVVAEGRARSRESAVESVALVEALAVDLPAHAGSGRGEDEAVYDERQRRIRNSIVRLAALLSELPDAWRTRLLEGLEFLEWINDLAYDSGYETHHYQSEAGIANEVTTYLRRALGAFLRSDAEPPKITKRWIEYRHALGELKQEKEWEFAREIAEDDEDHRKWLERNPKAVEKLAMTELPDHMWDRS